MSAQAFINKANHNQKLIELLEAQTDSTFPDWVVTALFYKGLHWLGAWLTSENCPRDAFDAHGKMRVLIDYRPRFNKPLVTYPVNKNAYNAYDDLYEFSITARYDGFLNEEAMKKLNQSNVAQCKKSLEIIKSFIEGKGLSLSEDDSSGQINDQAANAR